MTTLNVPVLKRTIGLLADIDRLLAEPTIAERVERVLSSAVSVGDRLTDVSMENIDAILDVWCADDESSLWQSAHAVLDLSWFELSEGPGYCGCDRFIVTETHPYGGDQPYSGAAGPSLTTYETSECHFYDPIKTYPIQQSGIFTDSIAREACGVEGCECEALFQRPRSPNS